MKTEAQAAKDRNLDSREGIISEFKTQLELVAGVVGKVANTGIDQLKYEELDALRQDIRKLFELDEKLAHKCPPEEAKYSGGPGPTHNSRDSHFERTAAERLKILYGACHIMQGLSSLGTPLNYFPSERSAVNRLNEIDFVRPIIAACNGALNELADIVKASPLKLISDNYKKHFE